MTAELRDALAADRAVRRRAAWDVIPLAEGLALRHPGLDDVHYLNAVLLDSGPRQLGGAAAARLADRWLGDLGHRHVVFDDADAGEHAAADLAAEGWERERTVFMVFAGDPAELAADPRARSIADAEMDALQLASLREQAPSVDARTDLVVRLVATQRRLRATTPSCCFGAGPRGGELASMCTLFLDPDVDGRRVAMITDVGTRVAHREQGLARAVVSAAVGRAGRWGAALIVVGADADDWPQVMYSRLGFVPVGRQVAVTRRLPAQVRAGCDSVSGAL